MKNISSILLGGGSFWISEAVFKNVQGILRVTPGYAGGNLEKPVYREVCSGKTGHVEVVKIQFDSQKIDLTSILNIFFAMHDPTLKNKQGVEKGSQYRSYIGCESLEQSKIVKSFVKKLSESDTFPSEILTELEINQTFFEAEYYHHNYYQINQTQPYTQRIIIPLVEMVEQRFKDYYITPLLAS